MKKLIFAVLFFTACEKEKVEPVEKVYSVFKLAATSTQLAEVTYMDSTMTYKTTSIMPNEAFIYSFLIQDKMKGQTFSIEITSFGNYGTSIWIDGKNKDADDGSTLLSGTVRSEWLLN